MIQILNLIGHFFLRIKDAFRTDLISFVRSFLIASFLLFALCHFIPQKDIDWYISEYILEIFLFMIVYPAMIFLLWCPSKKEKTKTLFVVLEFYLRVVIACLLVVIPPLFFNYIALWISGCFGLFKTVKFWIFVLFEIFVYGLMLGFNLDLGFILLWCLVCEIYLLFWIYGTKDKQRVTKKVKK